MITIARHRLRPLIVIAIGIVVLALVILAVWASSHGLTTHLFQVLGSSHYGQYVLGSSHYSQYAVGSSHYSHYAVGSSRFNYYAVGASHYQPSVGSSHF